MTHDDWMRALAQHVERMGLTHPDDRLLLAFDIDGTIVSDPDRGQACPEIAEDATPEPRADRDPEAIRRWWAPGDSNPEPAD